MLRKSNLSKAGGLLLALTVVQPNIAPASQNTMPHQLVSNRHLALMVAISLAALFVAIILSGLLAKRRLMNLTRTDEAELKRVSL